MATKENKTEKAEKAEANKEESGKRPAEASEQAAESNKKQRRLSWNEDDFESKSTLSLSQLICCPPILDVLRKYNIYQAVSQSAPAQTDQLYGDGNLIALRFF
jgi:hypothetical protein